MNPIDISFAAVMLYGFYKGSSQGFLGGVLNFIKLALGIYLALRFGAAISAILQRVFHIPSIYAPILSFITILIGVMGATFVFGSALDLFIKATRLGPLNRGLGIFLWGFLLTLGFSTILVLGDKGRLIPADMKTTSKVFPYVEPVANVVYCKLGYLTPAIDELTTAVGDLADDMKRAAMGECVQ
jgi:uncharacterized membrane protein required for colicin V production